MTLGNALCQLETQTQSIVLVNYGQSAFTALAYPLSSLVPPWINNLPIFGNKHGFGHPPRASSLCFCFELTHKTMFLYACKTVQYAQLHLRYDYFNNIPGPASGGSIATSIYTISILITPTCNYKFHSWFPSWFLHTFQRRLFQNANPQTPASGAYNIPPYSSTSTERLISNASPTVRPFQSATAAMPPTAAGKQAAVPKQQCS